MHAISPRPEFIVDPQGWVLRSPDGYFVGRDGPIVPGFGVNIDSFGNGNLSTLMRGKMIYAAPNAESRFFER